MRSKVLLLSALLHGAGITCAVVAVHAGTADHRPAPRLQWSPSEDLPLEPLPPPRAEPFLQEDPGPAAAEPDAAPVEPFDPEAFAPEPPAPRVFREPLPIPDSRVLPAAEPVETPAPEAATEPEPATPSEAAYVEARVLESENEPPRYPRRPRLMGWEGEVHVEVRVGIDGRAEEVRLAKACRHPDLNREALRAVREWRFAPATRGGCPETAVILVPVEFRLK